MINSPLPYRRFKTWRADLAAEGDLPFPDNMSGKDSVALLGGSGKTQKEPSLVASYIATGVIKITRVQSLAYRADIRTEVANSGDGARDEDSDCC